MQTVNIEKSGEVRDAAGKRIGFVEDGALAEDGLRKLSAYAGAVARGYERETGENVRLLASPQGEISQRDAQTSGTVSTAIANALDTIADIVSPVTLISKTLGTWMAEDVTQDLALPVMPTSAGTASPPKLNPKLMTKSIDATIDRSLSVEMPTSTWDNADLDLNKVCVRRLINAHKLAREIRVAAVLLTSANWPSSNVTAAAAKWDGGVSNNPLGDYFAATAKSLVPPTHLVFSEPAEQYFFGTGVQTFVQAGGKLPKVIVGRVRKVTSGSPAYVWGQPTSANAFLIYTGRVPEEVSTMRTFRFIGDATDREAAEEADGYLLRTFFDERVGAAGRRTLVVTANDVDSLLVPQLGGIITGVLA